MRRAGLAVVVMVLGALFASSCTVHGHARVTYTSQPVVELVEIRPGVWVAVDYPRPLFYLDGYYWVHRGGQWMRSYTYYGDSWVIVHTRYVPAPLHRLDRPPRTYVRYRPPPERVRYVAPRARERSPAAERAPQPRVRDHREAPREPRQRPRDHERVPAERGGDRDRDPPPRVRDHRESPPEDRDRSREHERVPAERGRPR